MANTAKTTTKNTNTNNTEVTKLKEENLNLKNELEEIKKMIAELALTQSNQPQTTSVSDLTETKDTYVDIHPNKYIKVMSLNFGKLILCTEGFGGGKIFIFYKFGDVRNIPYSDLVDIIRHNQRFAEEGRFYICDKDVVNNQGLISYYDKFLNKEVIDNILNYTTDKIGDLFNNTTDTQKDIIVEILIKKIKDGENVDLNKIDIISRLYGKNIYEIAKSSINNITE